MLKPSLYVTAICCVLCGFGPAIAETMMLPVPLRTIYPKSELRADDFSFKEYEVNEVARRTYLTSVAQAERLIAARALPAGKPIPLHALKRMADVRKGEQTLALYSSGGIQIQGVLVPEQDASVGDVIRVRNPDTGVSLFARVAADGTLSVGEIK